MNEQGTWTIQTLCGPLTCGPYECRVAQSVTHLLSSHCVHWVEHRLLLPALLLLFYCYGLLSLLPSLELTGFYSNAGSLSFSYSSGEVPDHSSEGSYVHTDRPEDVGTE